MTSIKNVNTRHKQNIQVKEGILKKSKKSKSVEVKDKDKIAAKDLKQSGSTRKRYSRPDGLITVPKDATKKEKQAIYQHNSNYRKRLAIEDPEMLKEILEQQR